MRGSPFASRPKPAPAAAARTPEPPTRKVFSCIVDDTALIAGVKKSTRDGIRKWIAQGAIRLFVPLHTLTALHRLKTGSDRLSADAREAVKWLDDITSTPAPDVADRVQLEGVDEAYASWDHVAKFLLPDTLLSMHDCDSDDDDDADDGYHEDLESSFNALDMSDETSLSSTHSLDNAPATPESPRSSSSRATKRTDDALRRRHPAAVVIDSPSGPDTARPHKLPKSVVSPYLQPLFNHVLWRINNESNPDAALVSFILLTNDPTKQAIAQKFGIRAKRLEQLRDTVAREDREYKNHQTLYRIELESIAAKEKPPPPAKAQDPPKAARPEQDSPDVNSDDEDVVLFHRAPRGPARPASNQPASSQRVWDPNDFGRTAQQPSPRGGGGRGGQATPRARGGPSARGRGAFASRGAYVAPGPAFRTPPVPRHDPNQPIDPNSFARPIPRVGPVRGNGRRKLWEPN